MSNHKQQTPIVVVQTITVLWTKQSRGGKAAEARNQTPERLELPPALPAPGSAAAMQHLYYIERNAFSSPAYQRWTDLDAIGSEPMSISLYADDDSGFSMPRLLLSASDGMLNVGFDWTRFAGMPRRYPKIDQYILKPGEWAQLRCNARSSGGWEEAETWGYLKLVVNVGLTPSFVPTLFCANPPTYQQSDMADLW